MIKEESELLTRTDRGTPCGELMRRYWQPAGLSEELPEVVPHCRLDCWGRIWSYFGTIRVVLGCCGFTV